MQKITSQEIIKKRLEIANSKPLEEKIHFYCEIIRDSRDSEDPVVQKLRMNLMLELNKMIKETPKILHY
jgi:hypothetical protein